MKEQFKHKSSNSSLARKNHYSLLHAEQKLNKDILKDITGRL